MQYVKRRPEEKFLPDCVIQTVKHPTKVMIWSVICGRGLGRLQIVNGIMRQDQYVTILKERLIPQLQEWFPNGNCIFMQDGAPCHTAKSVKKFLNDNNILLLDWPGNSPDLNPIENTWELLKREISKEKITNKTTLIEKIIFNWNHNEKLKQNALNCIHSMPRRVKAVIEAKGGSSKY